MTIISPVNDATVLPSVHVQAHVSACNGAPTATFGFSIDDSTTLIEGATANDIDTFAVLTAGPHLIHFSNGP